MPRGDAGDRHRRDLGEIELVGDGEQPVVGNRDLAAVQAGAHDAKAAATNQHRPAVDVSAGLGAGGPRQVGRRSAERALRDPHVERVDGRVGDVDELFAGSRLRIGELVELKGAADGVKSCCAHRATVGRAIAGDAEPVACPSMIILDGGTGTLIQALGAPMDGDTWCADANLTHPEIVRQAHRQYLDAGAEVLIANTYATSPLLFNHIGRDADVALIDAAAVRLAREASDGRCPSPARSR